MTVEMTEQNSETPSVEAQVTPDPSPEVTPQETPTPEGETPAPEGQVATPPPYEPNPVYKVRGADGIQVEKRLPDYVLPLIKDAKMEAELREIWQKADGIEFLKQNRDMRESQLKQKVQQYEQQYTPVIQAVQKLAHFAQQKDYASFFNHAGIPPQEIFQWALNYAQMSPDQRTAHERAQAEAARAYDLEQAQMTQQQQFAQQAAEYRSRELDFTLGRPEVSQAAQAFDARFGEGAFRAEVIRRGQFYAHQGQDISAEQAVNEVLRLVGQGTQQVPQATPQPQGAAIPQQVPQGQQAPTVPQAQAQKPVIPNIQGRGTSPAKRVPKSLADLRKIGRELAE